MVRSAVNAPPLRIDAVTGADFPRLAEVWEASVRATHHFLEEAYLDWIRERLVPEFLPTVSLHAARDAEGRIVGFLGVAGDRIEMLFVDPEWRGQGVGRLLATHAVDALGARALDVNEQNDQAVGFYRRLGFEVEGRSALDGMGKPYPLLHMRLGASIGEHDTCS